MEDKIKLLTSELGDHRIKKDVSLSEYLASKVGGRVAYLFLATSQAELMRAVSLARELTIKYTLVGSGSKITFDQGDYPGLVIKNKSSSLRIFGIKGKVLKTGGLGISEAFLEADSGCELSKLSLYAQTQLLTGFEGLEFVPGTIGGSILHNGSLREKTHQLKILNSLNEVENKSLLSLLADDVILSVIFKLKSKTD